MISNNMLEHIRKSIEEGELFDSHVPVVKQLLDGFDEQAIIIMQLQSDNAELLLSRDMEHERHQMARKEIEQVRRDCDYAVSSQAESIRHLEFSVTTQASEIARLKAQLAITWQPVADGDFDCDCSDSECRNKYTIEADGIFLTISEGDDFLTVDLGSRRLCKQVQP